MIDGTGGRGSSIATPWRIMGDVAVSLLQSLRDIPIAVIDVETTGASASLGDAVIEVGIARVMNGAVVGRYEQLIDPRRGIGPGITALTGITPAMCQGQPTFAQQLPRMMEYLRGAVVMGHNVGFDLSFLHGEFHRCRRSLEESLGRTHVLDTVRIARRRFGRGGNGLQNLARKLGVKVDAAHRALSDCLTTLGVFDRLINTVGGWGMSLCDCLAAQGGPIPLVSAAVRERILPLELEEALEARCPVEMIYLDAEGEMTRRLIRPMQIRRRAGEFLLIAHCHLRDAQRTFKVSRIVELRRIEEAGAME